MAKIIASSVGLLVALLTLAPAFATDLPVQRAPARERAVTPRQAPTQTASNNWSGGQVGGSNGTSSVNNNFVEPGAFNFNGCAAGACQETPFAFNKHSWTYIIGAFAGYRVQMGNTVVGVEADLYWKNARDSRVQNTPPPNLFTEQFYGTQKQGVDASFRARFGMLTSFDSRPQSTLVYVTGGLAVGQVSGKFSYNACNFEVIIVSPPPVVPTICVSGAGGWNETRVGWTAGGGVEHVLWGPWKARVEYRYTDLGSFTKTVPLRSDLPCAAGICGTLAVINLKASDHRFTVGLGYDF